MLSHLNNTDQTTMLPHKANIRFLYSSRLHPASGNSPILDQILFLPRLRQLARSLCQSTRFQQVSLSLFITGSRLALDSHPSDLRIYNRRINSQDLHGAVAFSNVKGESASGDESDMTKATVCYVCGPKPFTVAVEKDLNTYLHHDGNSRRCVFHELWW